MPTEALAELANTPVPLWLFATAHPELVRRLYRTAVRRGVAGESEAEGDTSS